MMSEMARMKFLALVLHDAHSPRGNEHVVDSRPVVSGSVGKPRFGAGGQGKMWAALSIYMLES